MTLGRKARLAYAMGHLDIKKQGPPPNWLVQELLELPLCHGRDLAMGAPTLVTTNFFSGVLVLAAAHSTTAEAASRPGIIGSGPGRA